MSKLRKLGHRISKAFSRISTKLTNMVMPKSQAMSFEEMMTMDDEDLGKKYRESGNWKDSKSYRKLIFFPMTVCIPVVGITILVVLMTLTTWITKPVFNIITNMNWATFVVLAVITLFIVCFADSTPFFKRLFHYDHFDNLMTDGNFDNFKSNMSYDKNADTGLSRYMNCFQQIVSNIQSCSDSEIGRLLKLMLPIAFMKRNGVRINERNYSSINEQYHLTDGIRTLVNDIEARMEQKRVQSGEKQKEERKTSEALDRLKDLDDRVKTRKEALDGSSDYHRLMDATNQLKHKANTIRETSSGLTEEKA